MSIFDGRIHKSICGLWLLLLLEGREKLNVLQNGKNSSIRVEPETSRIKSLNFFSLN